MKRQATIIILWRFGRDILKLFLKENKQIRLVVDLSCEYVIPQWLAINCVNFKRNFAQSLRLKCLWGCLPLTTIRQMGSHHCLAANILVFTPGNGSSNPGGSGFFFRCPGFTHTQEKVLHTCGRYDVNQQFHNVHSNCDMIQRNRTFIYLTLVL